MSKGTKQKLGIVSALMLDSTVLILDEPTSGLDPLMQKTLVELILEEKNRGKTIFMSSHQFSEIEKTCEQVGIIREGELLTVQNIT
jgi:ABC-2 type transport system ATP-binding protein